MAVFEVPPGGCPVPFTALALPALAPVAAPIALPLPPPAATVPVLVPAVVPGFAPAPTVAGVCAVAVVPALATLLAGGCPSIRKDLLCAPSLRFCLMQGWGLSFPPFPISIFEFRFSTSGKQMRPDDADEFAGSDDFGFLPELWEMPRIAGDQVVRAGGIGAFDENVIGGIGRNLQRR